LARELRPALTGWMAHERPFAFEPSPIVYAESMYRFGHGTPTIPGYVVAAPGHEMIRTIGVPQIREHNVRLTGTIIAMSLERGLVVKTPLDPERRTGWIGIDFEGAEAACRELVAQRVYVDYRPSCGIRLSPHFYTVDDEIEAFFKALDRLR
jgi:kynureninase